MVLAAVAAMALAGIMTPSARAQSYDYATPLQITTAGAAINNSATSNYTAVVNVRKAGQNGTVGIFQKYQLDGAGTGGNILAFSKSVDGVNFESTPSILITNVSAGTTAKFYFNAVSVAGAQAIRLESLVNGSAAKLTNVLVQVGIPNRP